MISPVARSVLRVTKEGWRKGGGAGVMVDLALVGSWVGAELSVDSNFLIASQMLLTAVVSSKYCSASSFESKRIKSGSTTSSGYRSGRA